MNNTEFEFEVGALLRDKMYFNPRISFRSLLLSIALGGFAQIVLFIALCVFEFHHRHRDGVVADFDNAFNENDNGAPQQPQNIDNDEDENENEDNQHLDLK